MNTSSGKYIVLFVDWNLVILKLLSLEWDTDIGPILFLNIKNRRFGLCFCHRKKDRSIWFFGLERFFCSRCLGILFGGAAGLALVLSQYRIGILWAVVLLLPLILDGFSQAFHIRESNNIFRLLTGFLFGVGLQFFLAFFF
jgi:uncharacterized membrane protein